MGKLKKKGIYMYTHTVMKYLQLKHHIENSKFPNKILDHVHHKKNQTDIGLLDNLILIVDIVNGSWW